MTIVIIMRNGIHMIMKMMDAWPGRVTKFHKLDYDNCHTYGNWHTYDYENDRRN
jgi:hypothetical protein